MSKINNILKENYELRKEIDEIISTVKENEMKHNGFKVIQYSCLLSDNLLEISDKTLRYMEDIFNLDKVVLFIKEGAYFATSGHTKIGDRVIVNSVKSFDYTFMEKKIYYGHNHLILHKDFTFSDFGEEYSYVLAPVSDNGKITGALGIYSKDKERFNKNQNFDFIKEFALILYIALKRLDDAFLLEIQAQTDYLTGLPNKSMLEISADLWLKAYNDENKPFSFMMMDFNNFKDVNDSKGHIIGDEVLKKAASAIRNSISDCDMLGRFGGDEFYLFSDTIDFKGLKEMETNMVNALKEVAKEYDLDKELGLSVGIAKVPEDFNDCNNFTELLKKADERLYQVKKSGKSSFNGV